MFENSGRSTLPQSSYDNPKNSENKPLHAQLGSGVLSIEELCAPGGVGKSFDVTHPILIFFMHA